MNYRVGPVNDGFASPGLQPAQLVHMTIQEASNRFTVPGLDQALLAKQDEAFSICMSFLEEISKTKGQNRNHTSYNYKHFVETPSGRFGIPSSVSTYYGYIYEGTFILAALASGFTAAQSGNHLKTTFNISERDLKRRAREFAYHPDVILRKRCFDAG